MIRYTALDLSEKSTKFLSRRRVEIGKEADHPARAKKARALFESKDNKAFREILDHLTKLAPGEQDDRGYCFYCEHDRKAAIEHIAPLSHYPEKSHDYDNLILACFVCNSIKKSDKFAVFDATRTAVIEFNHAALGNNSPPPGDVVFLSVRLEDPFLFLHLDFQTGIIQPRNGLNHVDFLRADFTIRTIGLNDDALPTRRREYFDMYWRRLELLGLAVQSGDADRALRIQDSLKGALHPTVLREMRRQHPDFPALAEIMGRVPADVGA